jgi:hypothetical protein
MAPKYGQMTAYYGMIEAGLNSIPVVPIDKKYFLVAGFKIQKKVLIYIIFIRIPKACCNTRRVYLI